MVKENLTIVDNREGLRLVAEIVASANQFAVR